MPRKKSLDRHKRVLIIDKDDEQIKIIKDHVESYGYDVFIVNVSDLSTISKIQVNVIFLRLINCEDDKENILKNIVDKIPIVPIIVQTTQDNIKILNCFLYNRISKFFLNLVSRKQLCDSIICALREGVVPSQENEHCALDSLIAVSPAMIQVVDLARKAGDCAIPIMIQGEFGVGKKRLSRFIHESGKRAFFPFFIVNCGMIDQDKIEKFLFGDVDLQTKNSAQFLGKFIEANGGTIVLEEPDALPLAVQGRIYNFIETGKIEFFDSRGAIRLDVRLIFLTEKNLLPQVKSHVFRKDLYYRISVFLINISTLRSRSEDIPWLVHFFLQSFCTKNAIKQISISDKALSLLTKYPWIDNVQELKNILLRAVIGLKDSHLTEDRFVLLLSREGKKEREFHTETACTCYTEGKSSDTILDNLSQESIPAIGQDGEVRRLSDIEKEIIGLAMKLYRAQMSEVARRLGIGRSTLYRKIREYNIEVDSL
ncbi:sigma-54-dependent transcriptional regulator [Candidatus Liberibacter asiaticus]|uniref:sigma-54-dependent transcriptional regulator n=1 Tax=Liberibacter asiaticus TaxID=34021 RepID=UPI0012F52774|nr:sigma 54-interacting transcriptional regulator [Candidatus Liberibacter asiaticus]KAE9510671.1 Transcriptional regulatory protein ZraR [Candidatus Liberibacter asiaticus]